MIPRTLYKEEHSLLRDAFRRFLEKEVAPHHDQWESNGHVPRELWRKAGAHGFLCPALPQNYDGGGGDFLASAVIIEEIGRYGFSGLGFPLHSDIVAPYLLDYGSEPLRKKWLPPMVTGEAVGAIAMTEPGTGSDLQAIKSTAIKNKGVYFLNGSKTFITNGYLSDLVVVVAKTDPQGGAEGISLLLVEADRKGFSKGKPLRKIGMKAQDTCELFFDNVEVPLENLLGKEGHGFFYLMEKLPQERLIVAMLAVAVAEAALEKTIQYTKERVAFGRPVARFQNTRFKLAEMTAETQIGRVFTDRCVELHLQGKLDVATAAIAKYTMSDLQCKVVDECLQLHGGYGYMWDYWIARAYVDSRAQRIYAGTNEIMKEIISRGILED